MNLTERLNLYEKEEAKVLVESGIRNMRSWAKKFKKAICYFHVDL